MSEKWLYREQANYRLSSSENSCVVHCALGNKFVWVGSISCLSARECKALRLPVHQTSSSYNELEQGRFGCEEEALEWIIAQAEEEITLKPWHFNTPVIPRPPLKQGLS